MTKTELISQIAENINTDKKTVKLVLAELAVLAVTWLRAEDEFTIPDIAKLVTIEKPATRARKGINPFTKEEVMFKAKPASKKIKARILAKLRASVQ